MKNEKLIAIHHLLLLLPTNIVGAAPRLRSAQALAANNAADAKSSARKTIHVNEIADGEK